MDVQAMIRSRFDEHLQQHYPQVVHYLHRLGNYHGSLSRNIALLQPYVHLARQDATSDTMIARQCLDMLMQSLGPSRTAYVSMVLATKFPEAHGFSQPGGSRLLHQPQIARLVGPLFETSGFDHPGSVFYQLDAGITAAIAAYRLSISQ